MSPHLLARALASRSFFGRICICQFIARRTLRDPHKTKALVNFSRRDCVKSACIDNKDALNMIEDIARAERLHQGIKVFARHKQLAIKV